MRAVIRLGLVVASIGLLACGQSSTTPSSSGSMPGMDHSNASGGLDQKFVTGMLPHHQAAIDMAKVELQKGKNPQVRALAQSIIDDQTREQGLMKSVAASHSWDTASMSMSPDQLMGQPVEMGMSQMAADVAAGADTDRAFLQMMIPHHAMAVVMAYTEAKHGTDTQLKQLATSIVAAQAREIGQMQSLLGAAG